MSRINSLIEQVTTFLGKNIVIEHKEIYVVYGNSYLYIFVVAQGAQGAQSSPSPFHTISPSYCDNLVVANQNWPRRLGIPGKKGKKGATLLSRSVLQASSYGTPCYPGLSTYKYRQDGYLKQERAESAIRRGYKANAYSDKDNRPGKQFVIVAYHDRGIKPGA